MEDTTATVPPIYRSRRVGDGLMWFGVLVLIGALASVGWAYWHPADGSRVWIAGLWALGPPLYFWFEYFWLFKRFGDPDQIDQFRYVQGLAAKIWAATAALLALIYSGAISTGGAS